MHSPFICIKNNCGIISIYFIQHFSQVEIVSSRQVLRYLPIFYVIIFLDVFKGRLFRLYVIASFRASFCYDVLHMHQLFTSILVHPSMSLGVFLMIESIVFILLPRSIYDFSIPV